MTNQERFMSKTVDDLNSDCVLWNAGKKHKHGYGGFYLNGKNVGAHRASYELFVRDIPKGMCVLHTCDNAQCVNPAHLFLGTQKDNMQDMTNKGRRAYGNKVRHRGDDHPAHKLNEKDIPVIRERLKNESSVAIAKDYQVDSTTILNIKHGKSWGYIK